MNEGRINSPLAAMLCVLQTHVNSHTASRNSRFRIAAMATSMQLQPQSEVTMTLTAIVFKPDSVVTIGRGAEGAGRLPQDWLQVSSKHCAIRYDTDKVCTGVAVLESCGLHPACTGAGWTSRTPSTPTANSCPG